MDYILSRADPVCLPYTIGSGSEFKAEYVPQILIRCRNMCSAFLCRGIKCFLFESYVYSCFTQVELQLLQMFLDLGLYLTFLAQTDAHNICKRVYETTILYKRMLKIDQIAYQTSFKKSTTKDSQEYIWKIKDFWRMKKSCVVGEWFADQYKTLILHC